MDGWIDDVRDSTWYGGCDDVDDFDGVVDDRDADG